MTSANELLLRAAAAGDAAGVVQALGGGADPNARDATGTPALGFAASSGSVPAVEVLLGCGADLHAQGYAELTALHQAARAGHLEVVRLLVAHGAVDSERLLADVLHVASVSVNGRPEIVTFLRDEGLRVARPALGSMAETNAQLLRAAHDGTLDEARAALDAGAEVAVRDARGMSALDWAAFRGHEAIVRLLVGAGAPVDQPNLAGWPPLGLAAHEGHAEVVRALLAAGADRSLRIPDGEDAGKDALALATERGHTAVAALLRGA